jgi:hypothetical protein
MKLTIEATERITSIDGVKARAWKGVTERGVPVVVFVHRIAVDNSRDSGELDRELVETLPPGRDVPLIDALEHTEEEAIKP